jgi:hypothetical protein
MAEGSMAASDDDGGEDGEEGDEGDDDEGSVSAQDSPSKPPRTFSPMASDLPHMREVPNLGSKDTDMSGIDDLPGPPLPKLETMEGKSGSPLKNVALTTSSLTSPVKSPGTAQDPFSAVAPPQAAINEPATAAPTALDEFMQQEVAETAPSTIPPPPPEPTMTEVVSAVEERQEEEEEEMLLDIVENTNNANIGAPQEPIPTAPEIPEVEVVPQTQEPEVTAPEPQFSEVVENEPQQMDIPAPIEETLVEVTVEQPIDDGDDFPDLLGGLEKQLNEAQAPSVPEPVAEAVEQQVEPQADAKVETTPLISEANAEDVKVPEEGASGM